MAFRSISNTTRYRPFSQCQYGVGLCNRRNYNDIVLPAYFNFINAL